MVLVGVGVTVDVAVAVGAQDDKRKAISKSVFKHFMLFPLCLSSSNFQSLRIFQRGVRRWVVFRRATLTGTRKALPQFVQVR